MGYPPQREMTDLRASLERCRTQVPGGGSAFAGCFRPPPVHGKRRVVEADGLLSAREVADRVCLAFASPHHEHLSIAENVAGSCTRRPAHHRPASERAMLVEDLLSGQQGPKALYTLPRGYVSLPSQIESFKL